MKKTIKTFISILFLAICASAHSQELPSPVSENTKKAFLAEVRRLHDYYMSAPEAGSTIEERTAGRNAAVTAYFNGFKTPRIAAYTAHRLPLAMTRSATSKSSGGKKKSKAVLSAPTGYLFLEDSIEHSGRGFKAGPSLAANNQSISFTIGVTGKGKNVGTVKATAKLSEATIAERMDADLASIREALERVGLPTDRTFTVSAVSEAELDS